MERERIKEGRRGGEEKRAGEGEESEVLRCRMPKKGLAHRHKRVSTWGALVTRISASCSRSGAESRKDTKVLKRVLQTCWRFYSYDTNTHAQNCSISSYGSWGCEGGALLI
jgi:hypothetical protein